MASIHPLLDLLHDRSQIIRIEATTSLGTLKTDAAVVIPRLLQEAENDSDVVLRLAAIKAIGGFGTNALSAEVTLQKMAESDKDKNIRRMAAIVVRVIQGKSDQLYQ
jgi:HEAT repeat protein